MPTCEEIKKCFHQTKNRASGVDYIMAEFTKYGGEGITDAMQINHYDMDNRRNATKLEYRNHMLQSKKREIN
jgi:hypothetical protein